VARPVGDDRRLSSFGGAAGPACSYAPCMAAAWEPISRVDVQVKGVDPHDPGLLMVEVTLSAVPPGAWPHRFENPSRAQVSATMGPPKLERAVVRYRVADDDLEASIRSIDDRIAGANEYYGGDVLPARLAAQEQEQAEADSRAQRVGDAQRRADAL
jgi:hypothetical protein